MLAKLGRIAIATICAGTIALSACGKEPEAVDSPNSQDTYAQSEPGRGNPTQAPTDPPMGEQFTFDQAAAYADGLSIEIAKISKGETTATQTGAEGTQGQIVTAEILVINRTPNPFDSSTIQVWGYYSGVGAPKIVDSTGAVGDSFDGEIPAGQRAKAVMAWAIPHEDLNDITIMIDGGTPDHGAIQFTGPVS